MKRLRVLVLLHPDLVPPDTLDGHSKQEIHAWKTEYDVVSTLRGCGHEVMPLGVKDELAPIREAVESFKPHVVFNLLEEFHGEAVYDHSVVSYLELLRVPYTGCNPRGLTLARDKVLTKKILAWHRIRTPDFAHFPAGRRVARPRRLPFPLLVKSVSEEASTGIAQASIVHSDEKLAERVAFVHEKVGGDALAEQYIEGRELYVGVIGNDKPVALPVIELDLSRLPDGMPKIAGREVKWDKGTQAYEASCSGPAKLDDEIARRLQDTALQVYSALKLRDYGRVDMRLTPDGRVYVIEANPNPWLAPEAELAIAAKLAGRDYVRLIGQIVEIALARYTA